MKRYVFSLKIKQLRNILLHIQITRKSANIARLPTTQYSAEKGRKLFQFCKFQSCKFQSGKIFNWPAILLRLVKSKKVPAGYAGRGSSRNSHENGIRTIIRRGEPSRFLRWISLCRAKLDPTDQLLGSKETFSRVSSHSGIGMVLMAD